MNESEEEDDDEDEDEDEDEDFFRTRGWVSWSLFFLSFAVLTILTLVNSSSVSCFIFRLRVVLSKEIEPKRERERGRTGSTKAELAL